MTLLLVLAALAVGGLLGSEIRALPSQSSRASVDGQVLSVGAQPPKITPANQLPAPAPRS